MQFLQVGEVRKTPCSHKLASWTACDESIKSARFFYNSKGAHRVMVINVRTWVESTHSLSWGPVEWELGRSTVQYVIVEFVRTGVSPSVGCLVCQSKTYQRLTLGCSWWVTVMYAQDSHGPLSLTYQANLDPCFEPSAAHYSYIR